MSFRFLLFSLFFLFPVFSIFSQLNSAAGAGLSSAAAEQFLGEAERLIGEDRWGEALALLERGGDFADVSSDISYLLAQARYHEGFPLPGILEALRRAFEAGRWERYSPAQAYLLEAEIQIWRRNHSASLRILDGLEEGFPEMWTSSGGEWGGPSPRQEDQSRSVILRLLALRGLPDQTEFLRRLASALDRYPRDPRSVEILFLWAGRRDGAGNSGSPEQALIELALRRLPFLLDSSPRLAYLAAPFIRDTEEARRLVSAYRALGRAERESLPISLDLGLLDDGQAVEEFFTAIPEAGLEKGLIRRIWSLLRSREGRELLEQRLLAYSGLIYSDSDGDGRSEERALYAGGVLREYQGDADQDGLSELRILFSSGGLPLRAEQILGGGSEIKIEWESYPAVLKAEMGELIFDLAPGNFFFTPIRFTRLAAEALPGETKPAGEPGLPYPEADPREARLGLGTLVSHALSVRRPSREFSGAVEHIELEQGIPRRAVEILEGKIVALTEFSLGLPRIQRLDLDLDGRMETIRHFRENPLNEAEPLAYEKILELVETDRDRDGLYEIGERFLPDGTVIYSWDSDGDGVRDYIETRKSD
jgi:hypothetical protein